MNLFVALPNPILTNYGSVNLRTAIIEKAYYIKMKFTKKTSELIEKASEAFKHSSNWYNVKEINFI